MSRGGAAGWVKGGGVGTAGAAPTHPPRPGARRVRGGKVQAAGHTRRPDPRSGVGSRHTPRAGGGADRKCGDRPASAGASRLLPLPPRRTTPGSAVRHRQCGKGSGVGRVWVGGGPAKKEKTLQRRALHHPQTATCGFHCPRLGPRGQKRIEHRLAIIRVAAGPLCHGAESLHHHE